MMEESFKVTCAVVFPPFSTLPLWETTVTLWRNKLLYKQVFGNNCNLQARLHQVTSVKVLQICALKSPFETTKGLLILSVVILRTSSFSKIARIKFKKVSCNFYFFALGKISETAR